MKKLFIVWWQDLVRFATRVYLPVATVVIFAMIAATYWPGYAHITTIIYLILSFIVSDILFKKK